MTKYWVIVLLSFSLISLNACEIILQETITPAAVDDARVDIGHDSIYVALSEDLSEYPVWHRNMLEDSYDDANLNLFRMSSVEYKNPHHVNHPILTDYIVISGLTQTITRFQRAISQVFLDNGQVMTEDEAPWSQTKIEWKALSSLKPSTQKFRFDNKVYYRLDRLRRTPAQQALSQEKLTVLLGEFVHYKISNPCPTPLNSVGPICLAVPTWSQVQALKLSVSLLANPVVNYVAKIDATVVIPDSSGIHGKPPTLQKIDADTASLWGTSLKIHHNEQEKYYLGPFSDMSGMSPNGYSNLHVILLDNQLYFSINPNMNTTY